VTQLGGTRCPELFGTGGPKLVLETADAFLYRMSLMRFPFLALFVCVSAFAGRALRPSDIREVGHRCGSPLSASVFSVPLSEIEAATPKSIHNLNFFFHSTPRFPTRLRIHEVAPYVAAHLVDSEVDRLFAYIEGFGTNSVVLTRVLKSTFEERVGKDGSALDIYENIQSALALLQKKIAWERVRKSRGLQALEERYFAAILGMVRSLGLLSDRREIHRQTGIIDSFSLITSIQDLTSPKDALKQFAEGVLLSPLYSGYLARSQSFCERLATATQRQRGWQEGRTSEEQADIIVAEILREHLAWLVRDADAMIPVETSQMHSELNQRIRELRGQLKRLSPSFPGVTEPFQPELQRLAVEEANYRRRHCQ
jgi:hypothetical protein